MKKQRKKKFIMYMYIRPCLVPHPKIRHRKNPSTRRCNLCSAVVVAIVEHRRGTHTHTHTHVHTLDHPGPMRARARTHTPDRRLSAVYLSLTHTYICKCDIYLFPLSSFFQIDVSLPSSPKSPSSLRIDRRLSAVSPPSNYRYVEMDLLVVQLLVL